MASLCPLCKQEVSKSLYEKITGIWADKENKMKELKQKEIALKKKEELLKAKFDKEKKLLNYKNNQELNNLKKKYEQERLKIENSKKSELKKFQKKIDMEFRNKLKHEKHVLNISMKNFELKNKEKFNKVLEQQKRANEKSKNENEKMSEKIKLLEEQVRVGQTPQMLGLLEEKVFLKSIKDEFLMDKFTHTGKGGDITHEIVEKGLTIGVIVYELKKVAQFSNSHVDQTIKAMNQREADYGILITNGKRAKDFILFKQKQAIVIRPAGAIFLVKILRDHLVQVSKLKLSKGERSLKVNALLNYIQGPVFKNAINSFVSDSEELYENLQKEVKGHVKEWKFRLSKYRNIHANAFKVSEHLNQKSLSSKSTSMENNKSKIISIDLPEKID